MAAVYARAHSAAEARQEALKLRDRALQRQVRALRRALGSAAHSRRDLGAAADAALSRGLTFHTCAPPGGSVAAVTGSASRVGRQHRWQVLHVQHFQLLRDVVLAYAPPLPLAEVLAVLVAVFLGGGQSGASSETERLLGGVDHAKRP